MANKIPREGQGRFQWNKGAWFGGKLGCTAWLLPTGLILLFQRPFIGIVWLAIFATINGFGFWMWNRRDRLLPYPAIQMLLLACGLGGLVALGTLHFLTPGLYLPEITIRHGRMTLEEYRMGIPQMAFLSLLFAALMGWAALMERSARSARANTPIHNSQ